jgi:hypothetical protein
MMRCIDFDWLNVRFTSPDRFAVKFDDRETDALEFKAPVNDGDRADISRYKGRSRYST